MSEKIFNEIRFTVGLACPPSWKGEGVHAVKVTVARNGGSFTTPFTMGSAIKTADKRSVVSSLLMDAQIGRMGYEEAVRELGEGVTWTNYAKCERTATVMDRLMTGDEQNSVAEWLREQGF